MSFMKRPSLRRTWHSPCRCTRIHLILVITDFQAISRRTWRKQDWVSCTRRGWLGNSPPRCITYTAASWCIVISNSTIYSCSAVTFRVSSCATSAKLGGSIPSCVGTTSGCRTRRPRYCRSTLTRRTSNYIYIYMLCDWSYIYAVYSCSRHMVVTCTENWKEDSKKMG